jgi:hypothetical protein
LDKTVELTKETLTAAAVSCGRRIQADPGALPAEPVVLDDSNSFVDVLEGSVRKPLVLNTRRYAVAGADEKTAAPETSGAASD